MNLREEKREKRREEILFAALALFVRKGYAATRTGDIAKAVHMSDGLLFHYFPTKEALYEELLRIGAETAQEWLAGGERRPLDFFTQMTQRILDLLREHPESANFFLLLAQAQRSGDAPEGARRLLETQGENYGRTVALIRAGQALGEIRPGDPGALAWTFWCSVQGIAEQLAAHPETPFPQAEWIVSILKNQRGGT